MKLVREHITEDFKSIFKPLSKEQIIDEINHMSQEEKNKKLWLSVINNQVNLVKLLLDNGAEVDNQVNLVKLLLDNGAEVDTQDKDHWTPLIYASAYGYNDIVKILIENGADIDSKKVYDAYIGSPLITAATNGNEETIKILLKAGANINIKNKFGWTALMRASEKGFIIIVKILIENGAKLNEKNKQGFTALDLAHFYNRTKVVELLHSAWH